MICNSTDSVANIILNEIRRNSRAGGNFDSLKFSINNEINRANEYKLTEFGENFIYMFDLRIADNDY